MATNRFYGNLTTKSDKETAFFYGVNGAKLNTLKVRGELSEDGGGSDVDFAENYAAAQDCFFTATAPTVIEKMVLVLEDGDYDETAAMDGELFVGGATALTNGISWAVFDSSDTAVLTSTAALNINGFVDEWGAEVFRHTGHLSATNNVNHDLVVVTLKFRDILGLPLHLGTGESVGISIGIDDLSSLTVFTGTVFGRLVWD